MTFDEFLSKWVCNDSFTMFDKQCTVTIQGIQCVVKTFDEKPLVWVVGYHPITGWSNFSTWDWSDVDSALIKHYKLEG